MSWFKWLNPSHREVTESGLIAPGFGLVPVCLLQDRRIVYLLPLKKNAEKKKVSAADPLRRCVT